MRKYPKPETKGDVVTKVFMRLSDDWKRHVGHSQVTYKSRTLKGDVLTYCLQDNGKNFGGIRLMRCSDDGEPCQEVKFTKTLAVFERPKGDSPIELLVNEWIDQYENTCVTKTVDNSPNAAKFTEAMRFGPGKGDK